MANNAQQVYSQELELLLSDLRRERLNQQHLNGTDLEQSKKRTFEILELINVVRKKQTGSEFICISDYPNLDLLMDAVLDAWNLLQNTKRNNTNIQ